MPEQQKSTSYTYTQQFSGVSFTQIAPSQKVYLFSSKSASGSASIKIAAAEVTAFREAFSGLLGVIEPGFGFRDTLNPANTFELNPNNTERAKEREGLHRHIKVHNKKKDNKVWLSLDPIVTLTDEGILFEVVDKRGLQLAAYMLKKSGYTGNVESGSGHIEAGLDLVQSLGSLSGRSDLEIFIGSDFDLDTETAQKYTVEHAENLDFIEKSFPVPRAWQRMSLQLQASSMLDATDFSMAPIDLYNIVRALHLKAGDKKMRILLVDQQQPRISIEPWDWSLVTTGEAFSGKTQQIELIEYAAISRFQNVTPFVSSISLRITGEAQPAFWTLKSEHFTLVLGMSNFRPTNWTKGLMLNKSLPRNAEAAQDLGSAVSIDDTNRTAVTHGIQNGAYSINVDGQSFARSFLGEADFASLVYRSGQERIAYELVDNNRVAVQSTVEPNGRRVLMTALPQKFVLKESKDKELKAEEVIALKIALQKQINDRPKRAYSKVTESQRNFQFSEPVFQPRLAILSNGATRLPECACTYYRKYGDKKTCAHVQALYIQYLHDVDRADEGSVELTSRMLVRLPSTAKESELVHAIRLQNKRVIEEWGSFFELNNQTCRRQVLAFNQISEARTCFFGRIADLEKEGFVNAG
ncbi:MAG: hypothetical protein CMK59_14355 [Proteobacteria bacterium]|nr:hypothetical protein [Pseudomonadota bacterium]